MVVDVELRPRLDDDEVGNDAPRLAERDRYAIRALALVSVAATAFVAGPEKYARTLAAFDWRTEGALSQGYRLDAWIDPPAYTGKAPIYLDMADRDKLLRVPVGSKLAGFVDDVRGRHPPKLVIDGQATEFGQLLMIIE